jgi:arylsulfatase A-like enzyme
MLQRKQPHPVVGIRLAVCCRLLAVWVGLASVSPADEPQRPPGSGSSGAAVSPAETESHPSANKRPNIVLLVADDIGYGELGCQGNEQIPTPHIDSLARQGVRFTNGYVTAAYCSASRAGLLTGRYQTRFGHEFNPTGARNEEALAGLPVDQRTLGQHLQQAGYATLLIGKWHLGAAAQYHPLRRGFDEFYGFLHEGHFFAPSPYAGMTTMLRRRTLPDGSQGRWVNQDSTLVLRSRP